ncbi:general secretion pathway protein GspL [Bordetella genomosp. 10]|uniref:General secretion pathway protein GspL n=1 Tax=Bordetella genomosp. 10 TaxID=1416804 RepID=A0A261S9R5_9BORD|nr:type II secretion system protein GspL [Bordetella genomosp. 10]OZI33831.1 general secretion pathway protein GspL [Bordetella genomosp. 10]
MKNTLRIALPDLAGLSATAPLAYAWFDRQGRCARSGELAAAALATAFPGARVEAVLAPADAIVATVQVPAVPKRVLTAAVHGAMEPLLLSDMDELAVGHGARAADGAVTVAWAEREPLARAWRLLAGAGLRVDALLPAQLVLPQDDAAPDQPLTLPADARWRHDAPRWSLALPALSPRQRSPWRAPLWWTAAAAAVWILGLNIHAARLRGEAASLHARMEAQVRAAFPDIPVVVDPLRQAEQGRNALLAGQGGSSAGDFVPLALATAGALPFAAGHAAALRYADEAITITLDDADGKDPEQLAQMPAMAQAASAQGLHIEKQDAPATWRITRSQP